MAKWGDEDAAAAASGSDAGAAVAAAASAADAGGGVPSGLPALGAGQELVSEELQDDGTVMRVVKEVRVTDEGTRMQVTKRYRLTKRPQKTNAAVEARKQWPKFGDCAGAPPGPEPGVTAFDQEQKWFFKYISLEEAERKEAARRAASQKAGGLVEEKDQKQLGVSCRVCGRVGEHWTHQCPYGDKLAALGLGGTGDDEGEDGEGAGAGSGSGLTSMFGGRQESLADALQANIRITNLSEETTEDDIKQMLHRFGPIQRTYVATDRDTGLCRGYAYADFFHRKDAQAAIDHLSGKYGLHHLIVEITWARPSGGGGGGGGGGGRY